MKKLNFLLLVLLLAVNSYSQNKPNVIYFLVDNLGLGELSCYDGGLTRGAMTPNLDSFASQGMKLWNFAPETQCTPSRSALMTGRYSIRSGNHTVALAGDGGGIVTWEKTIAEILSDDGYATSCVGKWHIGASDGRWPTDNGFDEWYGPEHSYDEALWGEDPWYNPERDPKSYIQEGKKGQKVQPVKLLTREVKRDLDLEYMQRSKDFIKRSTDNGKPFFLYFNYTLMHMPNDPRLEFKGKSGHGDWADCLMQLDSDFGDLLNYLNEMGLDDNTIVVFSGDNGPEYMEPWRGDAGRFNGSYFTGMEGSLRTPCLVRYPNVVPENQESNEIVHITDMFTTLINWTGGNIPTDRVIDGLDQRKFFEGAQQTSAREGFPYWMGQTMYGVKWQNFKVVFVAKETFAAPEEKLATPWIINLDVDPKEQKPYDYPYLHSWVMAHVGKILNDFQGSVKKEPLIPAGAVLDFNPKN
ncbi:MAG: sulfatase-like hydrolase/transferase [Flavobacteriaceae bacterium]|nr:sulfatase-like hydrolase/transferase [Mangrovimonas sp.]MCB0471298.1 sulfatase-like hydrolase/transferase [Flavobacteriaceae bacterium]MCB0427037.1 sulfatase-like hydrolase/transferase [Mangrovimonas sp.]MCB0431838.1 sulfatase-like hydrolase/transferase [Mangrovimonas sp.]MCB0434567.1 sulfatase-like hydrolase/transferase [Mangrovimonas sp.]